MGEVIAEAWDKDFFFIEEGLLHVFLRRVPEEECARLRGRSALRLRRRWGHLTLYRPESWVTPVRRHG
jgi:hypothetical protein